MSAVIKGITTVGGKKEWLDGRSTTCCPISSGPKRFRMATIRIMAQTALENPHNGRPGSDFRQLLRRNRTGRIQQGIGLQWRLSGRFRQASGQCRQRQTAVCAVAYLRPAMQRPNVDVQVRAHVNRVVIESGRAVGIEYMQDGKTHSVRAEKEVILRAAPSTRRRF